MSAAEPLFDDARITSPELALVDAALAARLRSTLPDPTDTTTLTLVRAAPVDQVEPGQYADQPEADAEPSATSDESDASTHVDLVVEEDVEVEQHASDPASAPSAPPVGDPVDDDLASDDLASTAHAESTIDVTNGFDGSDTVRSESDSGCLDVTVGLEADDVHFASHEVPEHADVPTLEQEAREEGGVALLVSSEERAIDVAGDVAEHDEHETSCLDLIVGLEAEDGQIGSDVTTPYLDESWLHLDDADAADETPPSHAVDDELAVPVRDGTDGDATTASMSPDDSQHSAFLDLIVGYEAELEPTESETPTSAYPFLPAPESGSSSIDETEAALRQIQQRLTVQPQAPRRRRIRRRFTIASGLVAVGAVAAYSAQVYLGLVQLPSL